MVNPIIFPFYTNISIYIYIYISPLYIHCIPTKCNPVNKRLHFNVFLVIQCYIIYIYIYIIYPLYPSLWPLHPHDIPILPSHHQIPLCFPTFGPSACASRRAQVKPVQLHRGSSGPKKWGSHNLNGTLKMGLT